MHKQPKTHMAKASDIETKFYVIDAKDRILGRVAAKAATILRGKHKRIFTPHVDCGDHVIIINAEKIKVTGKKMQDKIYQRYTGYPAGKRVLTLEQLLKKKPTEVMRLAVTRMIANGPLGYKIAEKLKVYAGDKHPHAAQKPVVLEIS